MRVLITGSMCGMGEACARYFAERGHDVYGIDLLPKSASPALAIMDNYEHYVGDVSDVDTLPDIPNLQILVNNAGIWDSGRDLDINLRGVINCTEKYALNNPSILSVLNQCDMLAMRGCGFPEYVASKGGVYAYTKWTAKMLAKNAAICNSISFGGVYTELSDSVVNDKEKWDKVMSQTPLQKWVSSKEAAEWVYFLTVTNRSCSGQDIVVDNLESLNGEFIW